MRVLLTLESHGIKIKMPKCNFFQDNIEFLGHHISRAGITKSSKFIDEIRNFPKPTTVTELRSFLGTVNFQRKFIPECSSIAKPLSSITGGNGKQKLNWTAEMTESFESLKAELIKDVELSYPDYSPEASKLELHVDASATGCGATLSQIQQGEYKTIFFCSMTFSKSQLNYSTIEKELTALRWAVKNLRSFLFGVPFIIYTDHRPLVYLHNSSHHKSRLARTLDDLLDYDFEIRYKPGKENIAADYLSRLSSPEPIDSNFDPKLLPLGLEIIKEVEGGGDSLFISMLLLLQQYKKYHDNHISFPESSAKLRELLIDKLIAYPSKYGLKPCKNLTKSLKVMRSPGQLPIPEVLLAFSEQYKLQIIVHYGIADPIIFCFSETSENYSRVHLQCLAGVHYNPLQETLEYRPSSHKQKNINYATSTDTCDFDKIDEHSTTFCTDMPEAIVNTVASCQNDWKRNDDTFDAIVMCQFDAVENDEMGLNLGETIRVTNYDDNYWWQASNGCNQGLIPSNYVLVNNLPNNVTPSIYGNYFVCTHQPESLASILVYCNGKIGCGLLDSGAEISLISEDMVNSLSHIEVDPVDNTEFSLIGIGAGKTPVLGTMTLPVAVQGMKQLVNHTFVVVKIGIIKYCFYFGSNFIKQTNIILDFSENVVMFTLA